MKILKLITLFVFGFGNLLSQSNTYNVPSREIGKNIKYDTYFNKRDLSFGLKMSKVNASSYFDKEGYTISTFLDTAYLGQYDRFYNIELEKLTFDLFANKRFGEKFSLEFRLPISYYTLDEVYAELYDTVNNQTLPKENKANFSLFIIDYLESKAIYSLMEGTFDFDLAMTFRLPFGSENGVAINSRGFWSDNAIELLPEFRFGVNMEKFNFGLGLAYNIRGEDLEDRLMTRFYIGLYSIPDSYISANFEWANSLVSFDQAVPFNVRKEPNVEDYFETNILFGVLLTDDIGLDFSYKIRLLGKNSWNYFGYKLGVFYRL